MKPQTHTCAAIGCQQTIRAPLLMCVDHWRMVPAATRRQVWGAYHRLQRDPSAAEAHWRAVREAIDAVHTKRQARQARGDGGTGNLF